MGLNMAQSHSDRFLKHTRSGKVQRNQESRKKSSHARKVEELVDELVIMNIENALRDPALLTVFSDHTSLPPPPPPLPPTPYLVPTSPAHLPLPSIETMLDHPMLPKPVYESLCFGEEREVDVEPIQFLQPPPLQPRIVHLAPVNKFGFREFETIKEEREVEEMWSSSSSSVDHAPRRSSSASSFSSCSSSPSIF